MSRMRAAGTSSAVPSRVTRAVWLGVAGMLLLACDAPKAASVPAQPGTSALKPTAAEPNSRKPHVVHGALPVVPVVAEHVALASAAQERTLVYVGARWCEPCRHFHRALEAGELDASLQGVRFIEYDFDAAKEALHKEGYLAQLIPLFVVPNEDGRPSEHMLQGSVKGPGRGRRHRAPLARAAGCRVRAGCDFSRILDSVHDHAMQPAASCAAAPD
jgi:thiol:disulfide interchange protein